MSEVIPDSPMVGMTYDESEKQAKPRLLCVDNRQYNIRQKSPDGVVRAKSEKLGTVRGVRLENIHVITDSEAICPTVKIVCVGEKENISDISLHSLFLNGEEQRDLSKFAVGFDNFDENIM